MKTLQKSSQTSAHIYDRWLDIRPSRYLACILLLVHGAAVIAISNLELAIWSTIGLVLLCIASLVYTLRRQALRLASKSTIRIWQEDDGHWYLMDKQGHITQANLAKDTYISTYMLVLNFKLETQRLLHPVVLLLDSTTTKDFHHLRGHLLSIRNSKNE